MATTDIATASTGYVNKDNLTTQAILDLQRRNGLASTGIIGDKEAYFLGSGYSAPTSTPLTDRPAKTEIAPSDPGNMPGTPNPVGSQMGAIPKSNNTTGTTNSNDLASQYAALQNLSPEEQAAQKALDDQGNASRQGQFNVSQQPIAQQFISGQQAAMQTQSDLSKIPLQQQLANAQQKRQASLDSVKFQLDRADTAAQSALDEKYRTATLNQKPSSSPYTEVSPGASLYDTKTNKAVFTAPTSAQTTSSKTLDTSNVNAVKLFQSANGLVADGIVGPKTLAKMAELGISPTGKTSSGTSAPTVTQQKSLLTTTLNTGMAPNGTKIGAARGADGYVDPYVYLEAFKQWTGTPSQFLTAFPVKTNINPASYKLLPAALQTSVSSSRSA